MGNMTALPSSLIEGVVREIYSEGKAEPIFPTDLCEIDKIRKYENIFRLKKKALENSATEEQFFSEKFDQKRSELLEKDRLIEELKNEVEKLKVELSQAQLLITEREETTCAPSESHATVNSLDNTGNFVHSQIRGNGDSLDRVEGTVFSPEGEEMRDSALVSALLIKPNMALRFPSKDERDRAIDSCWSDNDLIHVPRVILPMD